MHKTLVISLAMLAGACASNIHVRTGWTELAPVPHQVSGQVQRANDGDLIFRQEANVTSTATLDQAFSYYVELEVANVTTSVPAGAPLYELNSHAVRGRLYCTLDDTITTVRTRQPRSNMLATVNPNAPTTTQACFVDNDNDGRFEEMSPLSGNGSANRPRFGGMIVLKYDIEPIAYSPSATPISRTSPIGVRLKNNRLQVVGIVDYTLTTTLSQEGPYLLTNVSEAIPRDLPATIEISGARIEVLSREGDAITYRLANGFPPDQSIGVHLQ